MNVVIKKGLPIPPAPRGGHAESAYTSLVQQMSIGDALEVENRREAAKAAHAIKKAGYTPITRALGGKSGGRYTVWKTGTGLAFDYAAGTYETKNS